MRILYINPFFNMSGGIERYSCELTKQLIRRGHSVSALTYSVDAQIDFSSIYTIPIFFSNRILQYIGQLLYVYRFIRTARAKKTFDVILSNSSSSLLADIVIAHSSHYSSLKISRNLVIMESGLFRGWARFFLRIFYPINFMVCIAEFFVFKFGSQKIIAVSQKTKHEIAADYYIPLEKIEVVYNGVNLEEYKNSPSEKIRLRTQFCMRDDEIIALFCGHEFKRKGLRYVIQALALLRDEHTRLFVVGKDNPQPYRIMCNKLGINNKIIFVGAVQKNVSEYFKAADIFVFPTTDEPFGLVVSEALASGLCAIVSRSAGVSEILEDKRDAFLLPDPRDSVYISLLWANLIHDASLRESMSSYAIKKISGYTWNYVAEHILSICESIYYAQQSR